MVADDLMSDGQTEPRPFPGPLRRKERLEDVWQMPGVNSNPIVFHRQLHLLRAGPVHEVWRDPVCGSYLHADRSAL